MARKKSTTSANRSKSAYTPKKVGEVEKQETKVDESVMDLLKEAPKEEEVAMAEKEVLKPAIEEESTYVEVVDDNNETVGEEVQEPEMIDEDVDMGETSNEEKSESKETEDYEVEMPEQHVVGEHICNDFVTIGDGDQALKANIDTIFRDDIEKSVIEEFSDTDTKESEELTREIETHMKTEMKKIIEDAFNEAEEKQNNPLKTSVEPKKDEKPKRRLTMKEMFGCDWLGMNYDF